MFGRSRSRPSSWRRVEWDERRARALAGAAARREPPPSWCEAFVERGGQVVFFPPREPGGAEFFGVRWQDWVDDGRHRASRRGAATRICWPARRAARRCRSASWRSAATAGSSGEFTPLATLRGGAPLLARVPTDRGGVYFWTTTPAPRDSSLATDGVVLYAFVQRALAAGAAVLGKTRQLDAGDPSGESPDDWQRVAGGRDAFRPSLPFTAASMRPASGCWPSTARRPKTTRRCWPMPASPSCFAGSTSRASTTGPATPARSFRRSGGCSWRRCWWRWWSKPVLCLPKAAAKREGRRMNTVRSLTFLWTPWSLAASRAGRARHGRPLLRRLAAQRLSPRSIGALELLRLAIVVLAVLLFNQPEWVEEYPPRGEAVDRRAVGRLGEHGDARRADGEAPSAAIVTRREAIAPLTEPALLGVAARSGWTS